MECPECKQELRIPTNTQINMESYHNPCLTITECCCKLVKVYPKFYFSAVKYNGNSKEDDWGRKQK